MVLCLQREPCGCTGVGAPSPRSSKPGCAQELTEHLRANPALDGDFWCGYRAEGPALLFPSFTEPDPVHSLNVFSLQQLEAGQRRVSTLAAWIYARRFSKLLSSGPADAEPVVAWAVLAEGLGLVVSIGLCEVSCTLLGFSHAHLCGPLFSGGQQRDVSEMKCKFKQETIAKIWLHSSQAFGVFFTLHVSLFAQPSTMSYSW